MFSKKKGEGPGKENVTLNLCFIRCNKLNDEHKSQCQAKRNTQHVPPMQNAKGKARGKELIAVSDDVNG